MSRRENVPGENKFKLVMAGDVAVGKTSLLARYILDKFDSSTQTTTIGIEFATQTLEIDETQYTLQVWDTGGQERFQAISAIYYRGVSGVLLVVDAKKLEDSASRNEASWLNEIASHVNDVPVLLVVSKVDEEALSAARQSALDAILAELEGRIIGCVLTSAKKGFQVSMPFKKLARHIVDARKTATRGHGSSSPVGLMPPDSLARGVRLEDQAKPSICCS